MKTNIQFCNIIQARMNKCTYEQWFVTALVVLINVFSSPSYMTGFLNGMAAVFVIQRHRDYYLLRNDFAEYAGNIEETPRHFKTKATNIWGARASGCLLYLAFIAASFAL